MKKETVIIILESLMSECTRRFSEEEKALKIRNWTVKLADLTEEQGMHGLDKALDVPFEFMPGIGKFKELCITAKGAASIEDEANESWSLVMDNLNSWSSPVFKNSAISETIRKMGGWKQLCMMEIKEEPFRKKDFISMYSVMKRRDEEYDQKLLGSGTIKTYQYIGYDSQEEINKVSLQIEAGNKNESKLLGMIKGKNETNINIDSQRKDDVFNRMAKRDVDSSISPKKEKISRLVR